MCESGCANVASVPSTPVGPQAISVTVTPSSGSVMLGNQFPFTAAVKNSSDSTVTWSVNGVAGGAAQTGTISASGVYTAPGDLPIPANLTVTATSHADVSKSGSAIVTVQSDVVIGLPCGGGTNAVPVELGATHAFLAVVSSGAHPDRARVVELVWRVVSIIVRSSVDAGGNYIAPQILPASPNVTLTARSVADSSKQVSVAITIASNFLCNWWCHQRWQHLQQPPLSRRLNRCRIKSEQGSVLQLIRQRMQRDLCGTLSVVTTKIAGGNGTAVVGEFMWRPQRAQHQMLSWSPSHQLLIHLKAVQQQFSIQGALGGGFSVTLFPATATRATGTLWVQ